MAGHEIINLFSFFFTKQPILYPQASSPLSNVAHFYQKVNWKNYQCFYIFDIKHLYTTLSPSFLNLFFLFPQHITKTLHKPSYRCTRWIHITNNIINPLWNITNTTEDNNNGPFCHEVLYPDESTRKNCSLVVSLTHQIHAIIQIVSWQNGRYIATLLPPDNESTHAHMDLILHNKGWGAFSESKPHHALSSNLPPHGPPTPSTAFVMIITPPTGLHTLHYLLCC